MLHIAPLYLINSPRSGQYFVSSAAIFVVFPFCISTTVFCVASFRSNYILIDPDYQVDNGFMIFSLFYKVSLVEVINLFTFHPCDILFNYIQFFRRYNNEISDSLVGNCPYGENSVCLSCEYTSIHLVRSYGIFNMVVWWCLLVDGVNILTYFNTACLHGRKLGNFIWLQIVQCLERDKVSC